MSLIVALCETKFNFSPLLLVSRLTMEQEYEQMNMSKTYITTSDVNVYGNIHSDINSSIVIYIRKHFLKYL